MLLATKCRTCGERADREDLSKCPGCGQRFHERCLEYHAEYDCSRGARDGAVGAVEF